MTTAHDTSISWMDCPVCAELNRKFERADAEANEAWERFSFFEATYREAFAAGMVGFGTTAWTQWHDLLDQLRHAYYDATDTARARLDAWGESIRKHAKPQPAAEPEERKVTISKADATDELVNVYEGHIDKWLEALRERSFAQTAEPMPQGRDAYERLWYGGVPEITLPPSFAGLDAMTLTHCARAIGLYLRVLKQYAPVSDDASHVAHRLMDAFDDAAEARETALAGGEGEEK